MVLQIFAKSWNKHKNVSDNFVVCSSPWDTYTFILMHFVHTVNILSFLGRYGADPDQTAPDYGEQA